MTRKNSLLRRAVHAFGLFVLASCSSPDKSESGGDGDGPPVVGSGGTSGTPGDGDALNPHPNPGEEVEERSTFQSPVVTGSYLWSPNPLSGKVALISAETLSTRVLAAGLLPTHLAAVPSGDDTAAAIVINRGTSDASYFRLVDDNVLTSRIQLHVGANQWAISPSGRFAVAWSLSEATEFDPIDGNQELSIIDLTLENPQARRATVDIRPELVVFDEKEETLIVVSDFSITLLELDGTGKSSVPLPQGQGRDVSITRDGKHALVRREGEATVEILALDGSATVTTLVLPGPITDLDLSETGRAIAVVRSSSTMVTFFVADVLEDLAAFDTLTLPDQIIGSVELSQDGLTAVLYTNGADSASVSVIDLREGPDYLSHSTLDTQSPVLHVTLSPGGAYAVARAKGTEGSRAGAFTVLALNEQKFPRVLGTGAPIMHVSLQDDYGIVTASDSLGHETHLIALESLQVDAVKLSSAPISAGVLPGLPIGFAAQDHPEGRVTFFDMATANAQTLTGFELSAEAVQE
jgi:hypothetical protein